MFMISLHSIIRDSEKSDARPASEDEGENPTEDDEDIYENLTYQDTNINATDPPEKIHRGVEGDDEVEETLDWLQEHGATPPSEPSPVTDTDETTTMEQTNSSTQSSFPSTPLS